MLASHDEGRGCQDRVPSSRAVDQVRFAYELGGYMSGLHDIGLAGGNYLFMLLLKLIYECIYSFPDAEASGTA